MGEALATEPILPGFYPDPTICRVGDDYYLATSSFEYFPGAPIFHSTDLLSWTQIGHILTRRSQFRKGESRPSTGIWGSTLRHHDGRFWFVTTNASDYAAGQVVVHAEDPAGEWSEPVLVPDAVGIDPDLCWDDDGTCYLTWHPLDFETGEQGISQAPLDLASGSLTGPSYPVWQGTGLIGAEAPHLYRVGEWWYLVLAEGGTERGHCVTVARAARPWGPYEECPANPIFSRRSTGHPVQNTGHADLVETASGDWAAVYLGARPRGSSPGFHVLGRETFLAGIDWVDGWPVFDSERYDVRAGDTSFTDEFTGPDLDLRWVSPRSEPASVAAVEPGAGLVIRPVPDDPEGLVCTRVRDLSWTADAVVGESGRFLLRIDDRHWYGLTFEGGQVRAEARIGDVTQVVASVPIDTNEVSLRIEALAPSDRPVPFGHAGPDDVVLSVLSVVASGGAQQLARLDGRYVSTEVASGWTGRMLALGTSGTTARVTSVTYRPQGR